MLVILECEGKEYTVLVRQARVPVGYHSLPEIPAGKCATQPAAGEPRSTSRAVQHCRRHSRVVLPRRTLPGMLDGSGHFKGVAAEEIAEECNINRYRRERADGSDRARVRRLLPRHHPLLRRQR